MVAGELRTRECLPVSITCEIIGSKFHFYTDSLKRRSPSLISRAYLIHKDIFLLFF